MGYYSIDQDKIGIIMVPIFLYIYNIQLIILLINKNELINGLSNLYLLHIKFYSINNKLDNLSYYLTGLI